MIESLQAMTRPVVTLLLVGCLCYGFVAKLIGGEAFLSIVGVVVTFWFSQRQTSKETPRERATDQAVIAGGSK
jgi:hypothetical protein